MEVFIDGGKTPNIPWADMVRDHLRSQSFSIPMEEIQDLQGRFDCDGFVLQQAWLGMSGLHVVGNYLHSVVSKSTRGKHKEGENANRDI